MYCVSVCCQLSTAQQHGQARHAFVCHYSPGVGQHSHDGVGACRELIHVELVVPAAAAAAHACMVRQERMVAAHAGFA